MFHEKNQHIISLNKLSENKLDVLTQVQLYLQQLLEKQPRIDAIEVHRNRDGSISSRVFMDDTAPEMLLLVNQRGDIHNELC